MVRYRAHLLADRGAAAVSRDFFRSSQFLAAEGVTDSLVIQGRAGRCVLPVIVRSIPGSPFRDAVSPYGYPGGLLQGDPPDPDDVDFSDVDLVSVFVRDRLLGPSLLNGSHRGSVLVHDPARPRRLSKSFRRDLRRNDGAYAVDLRKGCDVDDATVLGFALAYSETMDEVAAAPRYAFGPDYFRGCLDVDGSWLVVVRDGCGAVAAGELVVASDGMLHSFLAGTRTVHRPASPGKIATHRLLDLADELGLMLNHGGGLTAGDGIEASKRSYCNREEPFVSHQLVTDPGRCAELSAGLPPTTYFPAYRASTAGRREKVESTG